MGLVIRKPGLLTTVQDLGRTGYMGSGFSPSGVMDRRAFRIANMLVNNSPDAAVLEFAVAGPTVRFSTDTFFALTGADLSPQLNGKPAPMYRAIQVRRGSMLTFGAPRRGVYGYLAVAGEGFVVPEVMGSRSTNLRCRIGGWHGRALEGGDYLPFSNKGIDYLPFLESHTMPYDKFYAQPGQTVEVRVVPGPQEGMFTDEGIATFYGQEFTTTARSDRMGYRLDGPKVATKHGSDIVSDGIAFGAVQVPNHGRPIVMLADRQTTGGYAKIGTVASVDIPRLVQCPAGAKVRFRRIGVDEAQGLLRDEARHLRTLEHRVHRPVDSKMSPRRTARRLTPILEEQARKSRASVLWIDDPANNPTKEK